MLEDIRTRQLSSLLRGVMIRRMVAALQDQPEHLKYDQMVKLSGSTLPYLLSGKDGNVKAPADLDLGLKTMDGLLPSDREAPEKKINSALRESATQCGYDFTRIAPQSGRDHCAVIHHEFIAEDIRAAVEQSGFGELVAANRINLDAFDKIEVALPVHYVACPINLLDTKLYENAGPQVKEKMKPFWRDHMLDILAPKLARVILGSEDGSLRASDMLDISRIVRHPGLNQEAMADPALARVLAVRSLADVIEKTHIHPMRFSFPPEQVMQEMKLGIFRAGYLMPSEKELVTVLTAVNETLSTVFKSPLTKGEGQFIENALHPDPRRTSTQNIDVELLGPEAEEVFGRYQGLKKKIREGASLNEKIDRQGARRLFD